MNKWTVFYKHHLKIVFKKSVLNNLTIKHSPRKTLCLFALFCFVPATDNHMKIQAD